MDSFMQQKTGRDIAPAYHYQRISQMKQIMRPTLAAVAVIAALGVAGISQAQQTAAPAAHYDKAKASELVGFQLAEHYPDWARSLVDPQAVGRGVAEALQGRKPSVTEQQIPGVLEGFQQQLKARFEQVAADNKRAGDAYLAQNKNKPGVRVTQDGLQYQIISQGTGPRPTAKDTVEVTYTGSFVNGKVFDSTSLHGNQPAKLSLDNVLPGFKEAMLLMPQGSHYKFVIPSDLAYGAQPRNGMLPNETLVFDVTLVKVDSGAAAAGK